MKKLYVLLGILFLISACSTSEQERCNREENQRLWEKCNSVFDSLEREITDLRYLNDSLTISNKIVLYPIKQDWWPSACAR